MPSFLELLEANDVLASVKAEGARRRRRRHRRNLVLGGVAVALLAVPAVALGTGRDDGGEQVTAAAAFERRADADPPVVTTTVPEGSIVKTEGVAVALPEAPAPTVVAPPPPTTVAPLVCRNSTNQACGDFYWDPAPSENQPLVLSSPPVTVVAGTTTELVVTWSDGDAQLSFHDSTAGDGAVLADACEIGRRFGPWDPPPASPGGGSFTLSYTAPDAPGTTDVVMVVASTAVCDGYHPYHSDDTLEIPINVVAP